MRKLSDLPIRAKARRLVLAASLTGLFLALLGLGAFEILSFRANARANLQALGDMISVSVRAAVQFDDADTARETLATLAARPEILLARIEKQSGMPLAEFRRAGEPTATSLVLERHLIDGDPRGGTLTLVASWQRLRRNLAVQLAVLAVVTLVLSALAYAVSEVLQRTLVRPVVELAAAAKTVSRTQDHRTRAPVNGTDELAELASAFNAMLSALGEREASLRESEGRLRGAFQDAPIGMALLTADRTVAQVNEVLCAMLGLRIDELVGKPIGIIVAEPSQAELDALWPSRKQRRVHTLPVLCQHRDGRMVPSLLSASWVGDDAERPQSFIVQIEDRSELKRTEQREAELQARLQQAEKLEAVGRLAGGIAHDFNNLLVPIMINADVLLDADPAEQRLIEISEAAHRARDLTRHLLTFARKQVFELRVIDLATVIRSFETVLRRLLRESINLTVSLPGAAVPVKADASQLQQVLVNLVLNAQDAMGDGGTLTVTIRRADTHAELIVTDTGTGFDRDVAAHIFEPFFTTKPLGKGTGLGLATVQAIVRQHQGSITVDSVPGKGTTFVIELPLTAAGTQVTEIVSRRASPTGNERIVVCEDDAAVLELAASVLRAGGYAVTTAPHPEDALAHVLRAEVDLLLTDVVMPGMSGRELVDRARAARPSLKVLFMSGYPDAGGDAEQVEAAILRKPFSRAEMLDKVRSVLDGAVPVSTQWTGPRSDRS